MGFRFGLMDHNAIIFLFLIFIISKCKLQLLLVISASWTDHLQVCRRRTAVNSAVQALENIFLHVCCLFQFSADRVFILDLFTYLCTNKQTPCLTRDFVIDCWVWGPLYRLNSASRISQTKVPNLRTKVLNQRRRTNNQILLSRADHLSQQHSFLSVSSEMNVKTVPCQSMAGEAGHSWDLGAHWLLSDSQL